MPGNHRCTPHRPTLHTGSDGRCATRSRSPPTAATAAAAAPRCMRRDHRTARHHPHASSSWTARVCPAWWQGGAPGSACSRVGAPHRITPYRRSSPPGRHGAAPAPATTGPASAGGPAPGSACSRVGAGMRRVAGPPPDGFPTPIRIKILDARRKLWPSSERLVLF